MWSFWRSATFAGVASNKFSTFNPSCWLALELEALAPIAAKSMANSLAISSKSGKPLGSLPNFSFWSMCKMHLTQSLPKLATCRFSATGEFAFNAQASFSTCLGFCIGCQNKIGYMMCVKRKTSSQPRCSHLSTSGLLATFFSLSQSDLLSNLAYPSALFVELIIVAHPNKQQMCYICVLLHKDTS